MIDFTKGNMFDSPAEALVNTVNEVGVMGKGIALMFRESFPANTRAYEAACKRDEVKVGHMFVTETGNLMPPKWIINFPTKRHWRNPSKMEWIREGLQDLVRVIQEKRISSIAIPPLGCGNGGLEWLHVKREIEAAMSDIPDVSVTVYAPTDEYQNAPKRSGVDELTPARALIAELVRRYAVLGLECTNLEVQKLAWFLHRTIERLKLPDPFKVIFAANKYGPYADQLRHLLNGLDGSYLHCEKRLADAGPLDLIWFENEKRDRIASYLSNEPASIYAEALERTAATIDGFESPLGMELLATVDWLLTEVKCTPDVASLKTAIKDWPGGKAAARRKQKIFDDRLLALAVKRLVPVIDAPPT
ncbi:MAG: macro domain-containing protein [Planctomycetes bacterium]|nr:macro domain-containing protein [Planctomycetota bacterium]